MSTPADSSTTQPITFHQNSPRPPVVPGEETCAGLHSPLTQWGGKLCRGGSPIPMPRRSTLSHHETLPEGCAPLGFEPEGSSSPSGRSASPPACLRWARCLSALLEDPDGVDLFRRYLEAEGRAHADALDFWFACEGLRKQIDPDKISQLVRVIHRRYFLKTQLVVSEELRKMVNRRIKEGPADCAVFTEAQQEVERIITDTTYPNFLRSDVYLGHVQAMQNGSSGSSSGSGSGSGREGEAGAVVGVGSGCMLATVHEDAELMEDPTSHSALPLTRDMLLVTQKRRATELRPKPEAYAGVFLQSLVSKARLAYSSYNPVSRQDSELQSLSSDARTESDNMSLTDSSLDGRSSSGHHRHSRKQYQRHCRQMKEAASLNRDSYMHHTVIPRTQRIQKEQLHQMKPVDFAAILIEKLENVKRNQETQEMLDRKLLEADVFPPQDFTDAVQRSLTETIREKLQLEDDNDQDILDQHVSRVWSDLTPSRSPGLASPRPKSPPHRRAAPPISKVASSGSSLPSMGLSHPYQTRPYPYRRKDKDVFSTFSSDSGNVHDFPDGSEHRHHLPKSKSMPDYADAYPQVTGNESRLRQCRGKWSSKKTELTDSGVSVVSDTPPASLAGAAQAQFKDSRVLSWLLESGPSTGAASAHSERGSVSSCGKHSHRRRSASPPVPAQPFVADPSMPPLPSPHIATQLEEARRRLMEDEQRTKQSRTRVPNTRAELSQSVGSTMRRVNGGKSQGGNGSGSSCYTTVVFSFCEEQFPYRTKIPGPQVTLRQFKEYLPKKGSYRYFFKTECEDLDMKVIQEEITDDNDILPLWEGKVMAQVKCAE